MGLADLRREIGAVNDLLCAASLLLWDSRTGMPSGGALARGQQIATLLDSARERLLSPATARALDGAESSVGARPEDDAARREVAAVRAGIAFHARVPASLVRAKAELRPLATAAWAKARSEDDWATFEPFLRRTVDLQRAYADAIGFAEHPYDALLDLYEPGETVARLTEFFGALRPALADLRSRALSRPGTRADFLRRPFPAEAQRGFGAAIGRRFGYDFERGRLDFTLHPFEISFTREDVRITMRRGETLDPPAFFGAFHEVGHGLYEQNLDPGLTRTALATDLRQLYAVGGASFGAHESQSRLWENHVGRSSVFWRLHFAELARAAAPALDDVDPDDFAAAMVLVRPGPIRTDADELFYDGHVMLRVRLEASLLAGTLAVPDVPEAWRALSLEELGIAPRSDREGPLQDIHWSAGMFGSFCTYTIGNAMAAQLFEAAAETDGFAAALARGEYGVLFRWLSERVWRHGRRFTRDELLHRATGRSLDLGPYLRHLSARYG